MIVKQMAAVIVAGTIGVWGFVQSATGTETVCPVVADSSISAYPGEQQNNSGRAARIKLKGHEDMVILKFDLSGIPADAVVEKATLSLKLDDPGFRIREIGYSTVPTDWVEGDGGTGGDNSCFRRPGEGRSWGDPGSAILDVIFGTGGNVTGVLLARKAGERYELDLPGRVIAAMRRDQPGGLILMDDSGWWSGALANIYVKSRESKEGPVLTVTSGPRQGSRTAPSAPRIAFVPGDLEDGQLLVQIDCGGANGTMGQALGFDVRLGEGEAVTAANWDRATALPRYRIPRPKPAGEKLRLWLNGLVPGKAYAVGVVAYDETGARSPVVSTAVGRAAGPSPAPRLTVAPPAIGKGAPAKAGTALRLWAVDELTPVDPVSGKTLGPDGYADRGAREGNLVWNGAAPAVALSAVRGEIVAFRLVVENVSGQPVRTLVCAPNDLKREGGGTIAAARGVLVRRDWYMKVDDAWYPNAQPELNGKDGGRLELPARDQTIPGQTVQTLLVEIAVPTDAAPGAYAGTVTVSSEAGGGELPLRLQVADVVMPDRLSFIIELNAYGVRDKETAYAVHRLAHRLRLGYNVCPYGHSGKTTVPYVPSIAGTGADAKVQDWQAWDDWMGPLLDGSLFKDLPRGATPIPHCYLPFYESYPTPVFDAYLSGRVHRKGYEAAGKTFVKSDYMNYMCANDVLVEDGFSDAWKQSAAAVATDYRRHFEAKGWTNTQFQIFANNKLFKSEYPSSLWTLDEPSFGRDFRALGFLYRTFKRPFAGTPLDIVARGDVSRPEWQGDRLDGACDLSVVSGAIYECQPLIQRRMHEQGAHYWFYGGSPSPKADGSQVVAVYVRNWAMGCEGGLAYWTSFHGSSWDEPDDLALVLGAAHDYPGHAVPTHRLSATRRAQQDIELLNLLAKRPGWSRERVARALAASLNLASKVETSGADDPGRAHFAGITAESLAGIRGAVVKALTIP